MPGVCSCRGLEGGIGRPDCEKLDAFDSAAAIEASSWVRRQLLRTEGGVTVLTGDGTGGLISLVLYSSECC